MYAIIESGGLQFKVSPGDKVILPGMDKEDGEKVNFSKVLFFTDGGRIEAGRPYLDKVRVEGEVIKNFLGKKIISFTYQRREHYERKLGFRRQLCEVKITNILEG